MFFGSIAKTSSKVLFGLNWHHSPDGEYQDIDKMAIRDWMKSTFVEPDGTGIVNDLLSECLH